MGLERLEIGTRKPHFFPDRRDVIALLVGAAEHRRVTFALGIDHSAILLVWYLPRAEPVMPQRRGPTLLQGQAIALLVSVLAEEDFALP